MAVTNIYTENGQIAGERTGGTFTGYMPDALGSVTAVKTGSTVTTQTYTPLGGGSPPSGVLFGWVGAKGYRRTTGPSGLDHVRRRHRPEQDNQWLSRDPLWPGLPAYSYVGANLLILFDSGGLQPGGAEEVSGSDGPPLYIVPGGYGYGPGGIIPLPGRRPAPNPQPGIEGDGTGLELTGAGVGSIISGIWNWICPPPKPQPQPQPDPGPSKQRCDDLYDNVKRYCKRPGKLSCSGLRFPADCRQMVSLYYEMDACAVAREEYEFQCEDAGYSAKPNQCAHSAEWCRMMWQMSKCASQAKNCPGAISIFPSSRMWDQIRNLCQKQKQNCFGSIGRNGGPLDFGGW